MKYEGKKYTKEELEKVAREVFEEEEKKRKKNSRWIKLYSGKGRII